MAMIADAPGFDTLSYARRLKEAGVDERQAEAHAEAVRDAITQGAASKVDLDKGLADLKAYIDKGLTAVGNRMDSLESRMANLETRMDGMASKADLDKGLAALETRMAFRFVGIAVGIVLANAGVTVAAVVALV